MEAEAICREGFPGYLRLDQGQRKTTRTHTEIDENRNQKVVPRLFFARADNLFGRVLLPPVFLEYE